MRRFFLAAVMFAAMTGAQAADMPDFLRGSFTDGPIAPRNVWSGFYLGGQGSYGTADMNFANANNGIATNLMAYSQVNSLTNVPTLGKITTNNSGFGGFAGYNWQWDDIVIGVEGNVVHGSFHGFQSPPPYRYIDQFGNVAVSASSTASVDVKDYGSLRGRIGYASGSFLPYIFGGVAGGRADINRSVSLLGNFNTTVTSNSFLGDHFIYGYSGGLGVDVQLFAGLFARAEYEYQRFTTPVEVQINTVRGGLGYKF